MARITRSSLEINPDVLPVVAWVSVIIVVDIVSFAVVGVVCVVSQISLDLYH